MKRYALNGLKKITAVETTSGNYYLASDVDADDIPDKKWNKVFHGTPEEYLRHRAIRFIQGYSDPDRGARMNQLAKEVEDLRKRVSGLDARDKRIREEARERVAEDMCGSRGIRPTPCSYCYAKADRILAEVFKEVG